MMNFNFDIDNLLKSVEGSQSSVNDIYRPQILKENLQSYTAVLKFLPWHKNVNKSIIDKFVVFLNNPVSGENKLIDDPTSLGKNVPSALQTAFFAVRESEQASIRDLQKSFKRQHQYFSLVQIIDDPQHPELNGQIKIFQYTEQIFTIVKGLLKPETKYATQNNPFDIFEGLLFNLNIKIKIESPTLKFPDYTTSKFLDKTHGVVIEGKEYSNKKDIELVINYLQENSPDLERFEYKAWTPETTTFVAETIYQIVPPGQILNKIVNKHPDVFGGISGSSTRINSKPNVVEDEDFDDEFIDDEPVPVAKPKAAKPKAAKPTPPPPPVEEVIDDDDDIDFDDFDLEV